MKGDYYGSHRVVNPKDATPQSAEVIDNTMQCYDNEILIEVNALHITSTAFNRLKKKAGNDLLLLEKEILNIVSTCGKFHDPVTKSGGILVGKIKEIGKNMKTNTEAYLGAEIATLVSLSLTPLKVNKILDINLETGQVGIEGEAILFESGAFTTIPEDIPRNVSLALMDVAGAPIQVALNAKYGETVVVVGAGKAGLLCLHEANKRVKPYGKVICIEYSERNCEIVKELKLADVVIQADATKPFETIKRYNSIMNGQLGDFTVNTVNIPDTELSTVLVTKNEGTIYFFSMSTDFSKASLGSEGIGKYTKMLIGNGYYPGHAENAFQIMRENSALRDYFQKELK